ncbi:hypothetical protein G4B88_011372 [Cannabis sativa]|uniref:Endonuclease/exonuclease/phosphatase domain-containing protein n=1 Tax=Cannabis sativa TaxID=3483 RepID=A0A7J6GJA4_CANSA|nr:hypothetical protein G4B88_011372 [Cannabis sativa]
MKAAPRRRNHTIGSRWLRNGPVPRATTASPSETNDGGQEHVRRPPVEEEERSSESKRDPNVSGGNHGLQSGNPMNHGNKLLIGNGDSQSIILKGPAFSLQDGKGKSQLGGNSMEEGKEEWRLTGVYGESRRTHRQETWDLLRTLKLSSSLPWCILGDLNNVASQQDKRGGQPYPQLIKDCWDSMNNEDIVKKIQACADKLTEWGKDITGSFKLSDHQVLRFQRRITQPESKSLKTLAGQKGVKTSRAASKQG